MTSDLEFPPPAIVFSQAVKCYGGGVRAVDGMDLTVRRGETVALLGPNGAGKSTAIGLLLGLLAPDSGTVRLFGGSPEAAVRAGRVGAMPQDGRLIPRVSVAELIGFVRAVHPAAATTAEIMDLAGITELARRRADQLSGGQTQRVRFAMALAGRPDLIVLDEPTAAMDVESRRELWADIRSYADGGRTVLFSTHHLEEADENADRIVVMSEGSVIADGTAAEIKRRAGGHTVRTDVTGAPAGPGDTAPVLDTLPGVVAAEIRGGRATLHTTDPDATVMALARAGLVRNLEVRGADLEEAFLALTTADRTTDLEVSR